MSAARGGYTDVCAMPNLDPVPDSYEHLSKELSIIRQDALVHVHPYGALTVGEQGEILSKMEEMAPHAVAFSDDGKGVQDPEMMKKAMLLSKKLGKVIAAHCEDNSLLHGGYIHDGEYARLHGHRGIVSESEWGPVKRDLALLRETGASYHVCHISCKETVELIRQAKKEGLDVTCETGPHYLLLTDRDLQEDGRFKMNPPLRSEEDRAALIEGIQDGTIDMIATDHAPHSAQEKSRGLEKSSFGIVGLETAFPLLYTYLVKKNVITLEKLIELMAVKPRLRFGIPFSESDVTVWDLDKQTRIDPKDFLSKGKATPFENTEVYGQCLTTLVNGKTVFREE